MYNYLHLNLTFIIHLSYLQERLHKKNVMKIKYLLAICLFSTLTLPLFAQDEEEPKKGFDKDKVFIGGNFGLSFGDFTLINVSPQLGYRFNNVLAAGVGIN